ncbi:hypothetical protein [Actinacidiphila sp. bgisy144]|uniref:hypothetical protein n=1 Tax=Actinacidiphila sp. bgisy144 TaxID=3413791 RepID=UPI003EBEE6B9
MGHPQRKPTFSGIDPDRLPGTINSLESDTKRLHDSATRFRNRFAHYDLDTRPLDRLLAISRWADGELPLLRRRQRLAAAIGEHSSQRTLISVPDSAVTPGAAARATAQGSALARDFDQQMGDHYGAVPEHLFAELAAGGYDGDFLRGFYTTLGPRRLSQLSNAMSGSPYDRRYPDHPDQLAYDRDVLARTFGGFTRVAADTSPERDRHAFWSTWFDRFDDPGQGFRPDLLLPLIDSGTYAPDFLLALADRAFTTDPSRSVTPRMSGSPAVEDPWHADHYVQLFDALAKCPLAAGQFVARRPDIAANALYPGGGSTTPERIAAFTATLKAATVTLRDTHPALSDRNTAWLLTTNLAHSQDPSLRTAHHYPAVSLLFSEILAQHWDDLQYAITSPAQDAFWPAPTWNPTAFTHSQNPTRDGLELHPSVWKAFMEESIRNPQAAASMSALFEAYGNKVANSAETAEVSEEDQDAVRYLSFSKGLMDSFYSDVFATAEQQLGNESQAWADEMTSARETLVHAAAGLATGPDGIAGFAEEKGQELAAGILESWIHQTVMATPDEAPKDLLDGIKGLRRAELSSTWPTTFAVHAAALLQSDVLIKSIRPVTVKEPGREVASTFSGDPYGRGPGQEKYVTGPADDFVSVMRKYGGGEAVSMMSPRQLDAYDRWVRDPAVVGRLAGRGAFDSLLGRDAAQQSSAKPG